MGVRLVEYIGEDTLHSKVVLIDDRSVLIGSYNMDARSDRLNLELGVWIQDPRVCHIIEHQLQHRMSRSEMVEQNKLALPEVIRGEATCPAKYSRMRFRQLWVPLIRGSLKASSYYFFSGSFFSSSSSCLAIFSASACLRSLCFRFTVDSSNDSCISWLYFFCSFSLLLPHPNICSLSSSTLAERITKNCEHSSSSPPQPLLTVPRAITSTWLLCADRAPCFVLVDKRSNGHKKYSDASLAISDRVAHRLGRMVV